MTDAIVEVAGETLALLPERACYWERTRTLLVADPHFGKAAAFRSAGVLVPRGTTTATLTRLDAAIDRTGAARVLFLGDFLHAKEGRAPETLRVINDWRRRRSATEMVLVRGNHDTKAGDPPRELEIKCVSGPLIEAPFALAHHPRPSADGYVIAGHIHPGVRLRGAGRQHERLPCFHFGRSIAVLPAFGEFTGLADIELAADDRIWVIADDQVISIL